MTTQLDAHVPSKIISGSTSERRMNCLGSQRAEAKFPERPSAYAREGTMLHSITDNLIDKDEPFKDPDFSPFLDRVYEIEGHKHTFTSELLRDKIQPAMASLQELFFSIESKDLGWITEIEFDMNPVAPGQKGTLDLLIRPYDSDRLICVDYKFGEGVRVSATENYQLAFYASGALLAETDDPSLQDFRKGVETIEFVIVQPFGGEPRMSRWETSKLWLELYASNVRVAYDRIVDGDETLKVGSWCRFCKAKPNCPEHRELVVRAIHAKPEGMSAIELAENLRLAKLAAEWAKSVQVHAHSEMMRGVAVPGYKLVQGRKTRAWKDNDMAESVIRRILGEKGFKTEALSLAQCEKAMGKKKFAEACGNLVDIKYGQPSVVPDQDGRPAYHPGQVKGLSLAHVDGLKGN